MFDFFYKVWHKILRTLTNQEELRTLISQEFENFKQERLDSKYDLIDPDKIPIEFIDLYASEYGEILDRQFSTSEQYLRTQIKNIVAKIKSKSLPDMVRYLLYTFNFSGDIFNLWTSDYFTFVRKQLNNIDNSLYSDTGLFANNSYLAGISVGGLYSDGIYPTPHFEVLFYLNKVQRLEQSTLLWERLYLEYFKRLLDQRRAVKQVPHYTLKLTSESSNDTNITQNFNTLNNLITEVNTTSNWVDDNIPNYIYWRAGTGLNLSRDALELDSFSNTDTLHKFKITFEADNNNSLQNKYFQFQDSLGAWKYIWYNVSSGGIDPKGLGDGLVVNIVTNDTAETIRDATENMLSAYSDFTTTTISTNQLTIALSDFTQVESEYDVTTGFLLENIAIGSVVQYGLGIYNEETGSVTFTWKWENTINPKNEDITEFALYDNNKDCVLYLSCLPIERSLLSSIEIEVKVTV